MDSAPDMLKRPRRWRWKVLGFCVGGIGMLFVIIVLAIGGLIWRLSTGPLEVSQIARIAETVLTKTLGGSNVAKVGEAELDWSWKSYGFIIRLQKIEAAGPKGGFAVSVPTAEIELRTLPILWGAVKPAALDLDDPVIRIDIAKLDPTLVAQMAAANAPQPAADTAPPPSAEPPPADQPDPRPPAYRLIEEAVRGLADALDSAHSEGFVAVNVRRGSLDVTRVSPQGDPIHVRVPDIEIEGNFNRSGDVDLSFSAKGEVGRWSMRLRQAKGPDGHGRRLLFEGNDATARDLVGQLPPDVVLDIPVYPTLEATLDDSGKMAALKVDLRLGAGQFHFGKYPEDEMMIDEGQITAHWDSDRLAFIVDEAGASTGPTTISVKGRIAPPAAGQTGEAAHRWSFDLGLAKGILAPRDAGGDPLAVDSLRLGGAINLTRMRLDLDDASAKFGGTEMKGNGYIDFAREKPQIIMTFGLSPTDWTIVRRAWPSFIAAGARNWFLKQVIGGRVSEGAIKLDLPMFTEPKFLPSTAIAFSGKIQGGAIHSFGNLPDAVGLEGRFSSLNRRFEAVADKGQAATRYPKKPDILGMSLAIPDSFQRSPKGHIEFNIVGENGGIGEIANAEPLDILDDANIRLEGIQGSADVQGIVDMVLEDQPKPEQIDFKVEAILDRFGSPFPVLGRKFQEGNIKITADPKGTAVVGKAKIEGVATDVNLYEPRVKTKTNERRDFKMTLDEATRQRMGLDLAPVLTGPVPVAITQSPGGNEKARHIEADLTTARLTLAAFGWTKGAGVPAKATLDLVQDDKGTHLDNISIESEGVQIKGRADLDKDQKPLLVDLSRVSLRKGDDAKIRVTRQPDQSALINFDASSFDVRGLIQAMKHSNDISEAEKSKMPDVQIKGRLARVIGFNDVTMSDTVLDASMRQGAITRLSLSGQLPGGRSLDIQIRPEAKYRQMVIESDDAGSILGFLDVYDRMKGGGMTLKASLSAPGVAEGSLRFLGFHLQQQQTKAEREGTIGPDGTRSLAIRKAAVTEETSFDKFAANYALRKGVITMTQGIAKGPATGATASGQIDLNTQKLQITGTFIPLYGLNNLVSRIPLLGEIAGAGSNEGLLGVTFRVVGSVDDPVLQVNPISAIAPGIFRKIFEYHIDEAKMPDPSIRDQSAN